MKQPLTLQLLRALTVCGSVLTKTRKSFGAELNCGAISGAMCSSEILVARTGTSVLMTTQPVEPSMGQQWPGVMSGCKRRLSSAREGGLRARDLRG